MSRFSSEWAVRCPLWARRLFAVISYFSLLEIGQRSVTRIVTGQVDGRKIQYEILSSAYW